MNNFDLKNRTAIITGGAQGFGLGIAKKFLQSSAEVIIWDIDVKTLELTKKELNDKILYAQVVDVSNYENVKKSIEEITKTKKIDIFVNNAGITGLTAGLWDYPVKEWLKVLDINLNGTFYCCKAIVPHMIKNNYGRIVNIASVSGKDGNANASAYSSSKAALVGLTECLAEEYKETGLSFNCLALGAVQTEMLEEAFPGYEAPTTAKDMAAYILDFSLNGPKFYRGKILTVSKSTP